MPLPTVTPAGLLRHRLMVQKPVLVGKRDNGEDIVAWIYVATVWAAITPAAGRELWNGSQVQSDVTHIVTTRHSTLLNGFGSNWRLIFGVRVFNVDSVVRRNEISLTMLDWQCRESDGVLPFDDSPIPAYWPAPMFSPILNPSPFFS